MNIELSTIEERIKEYRMELVVLQQTHNQMVALKQQQDTEFQQRVVVNQNRYQQLTGAIGELEQLKQKLQVTGDNNEPHTDSGTKPDTPLDRVPHTDRRNRHHRGADLRHRAVGDEAANPATD